MKPLASLERLIKADEPEIYAESLSHTVEALIATARLALDNETSGSDLRDRASYVVEETLAVAQALMGVVSVGIEDLQREQRRKDAA
ncbi:hypothetical protein EQ718_21610 (plasmid) [Paracoccus versutus]|uniref:Uncharacterized protein n=1 Tax=Paracoccus versutus TaxID=34007 RepID=A0AAQ0KM48_PARVE|nr:hypothetical protein [Paracoccus versutus]KGJ11233.1 hypothetical protein IT40_07595 [Paracoccus versutus]REG46060.1 hypothetical protein ATH84_101780 [Paracoccus versutus]WEJ81439.1 hypothetical protein EQ718_21610 [Paracoccus versutus]